MSPYDNLFSAAAKQYSVPLGLLRAVAHAESGMDPEAESKDASGNIIARGIMQLKDSTAKSLGVKNAKDPNEAIPAAAKLLKENLDASGGDEKTALLMYHGGTDMTNWGPLTKAYPGKVYASQAKLMKDDATASDPVFQFLNGGPAKTGSAAAKPSGDATLDFLNSGGATPIAAKEKPIAPNIPVPNPDAALIAKIQKENPGITPEALNIAVLGQKASEKGGGGLAGLISGGTALLTSLGSSITGGIKGLADTGISLAQGNPLQQALNTGQESIENYQAEHTYQPETAVGQLVPALIGLGGSVPGKVAGKQAGDIAAAIKGEQARLPAESAAEGATNVLLTALGASKMLKSAREANVPAPTPATPYEPNPTRPGRAPLVRVNPDGSVTRNDGRPSFTPQPAQPPAAPANTQAAAVMSAGDLAPPIEFNTPAVAQVANPITETLRPQVAVADPMVPPAAIGPTNASVRIEPRPNPALDIESASPELKTVVEQTRKRGKPINEEALQRHLEADELGVHLTEGQATRDPSQISWEQNNRGKYPQLAERFNAHNKELISAANDIKAKAAPDVDVADQVTGGDKLIKSYETKLDVEHANIKELYNKMNEANGGKFPVDGKAIVKAVEASPEWDFKKDFLPAPVQKILDRIASGKQEMNFAGFESLRTTLASEMRKAERAGDGNASYALKIVRNEMEKLPLAEGTASVKSLADAARAANSALHAKLKADPAMDAVDSGKAFADDFARKYVIGAKRQHIQAMKESLGDDPEALQTLSAVTMNHLKQSAGLKSDSDNFSQAGYRTALDKLGPKLDDLMPGEGARLARQLGNVAFYTQQQPRGSFVNNSNTTVAGKVVEAGKTGAEMGVNMLVPGAQLGSMARNAAKARAERNRLTEVLQPGAGIRK